MSARSLINLERAIQALDVASQTIFCTSYKILACVFHTEFAFASDIAVYSRANVMVQLLCKN